MERTMNLRNENAEKASKFDMGKWEIRPLTSPRPMSISHLGCFFGPKAVAPMHFPEKTSHRLSFQTTYMIQHMP
jgi:hypothetical protein